MTSFGELAVAAEKMKDMLVAHATNGDRAVDSDYRRIRSVLLEDPRTKGRTPRFVQTCRTPPEFWGFIQPKFPSYRERTEYLASEFNPLIDYLEEQARAPMKMCIRDRCS